jgi:chloramphenicol-sensitive protein RarD
MPAADNQARNALTAGILCYVIWGLIPLVFQLIGRAGVGPWEILTHRVVWGLIAAGAMVVFARQGRQLRQVLRSPKVLALLTLSALLIAINWVLFIWAVNTGRTLETSLGYYITPLINMAAGAALFRERIDRIAAGAMVLAGVGVVIQALALGHLPWMSIALAISFGGYGIVRKRVDADAQSGLFVECLLLFVPAAIYVVWLQSTGHGHFGQSTSTTLWLIASGPITAAPLALFAWAARRMPLSTMGFLQFLAPTISFGIGVWEGEAFTPLRAVSFVFIWAGAAVYAFGAWRKARALKHPTPAVVATLRA